MYDMNFLISKHMVVFKLSCLFLTQISWGKRKKSTLPQSFEIYWNLPYGQELVFLIEFLCTLLKE